MRHRTDPSAADFLLRKGWKETVNPDDMTSAFSRNGYHTAPDRDGDWWIWLEGKCPEEPEAMVYARRTGREIAQAIERKIKARDKWDH